MSIKLLTKILLRRLNHFGYGEEKLWSYELRVLLSLLGLFLFIYHSYRSWSDMASGSTLLAMRRISSQARQTLMKRRIPKIAPIKYAMAIMFSMLHEILKDERNGNNNSPDNAERSQYKHKPYKPIRRIRTFGHRQFITIAQLRSVKHIASGIENEKVFKEAHISKDYIAKIIKKRSIYND